MITDHELADELVKLAALLRMGLKPEVPPHVRYLLHACAHAAEEARSKPADPSSHALERPFTRPRAMLMDLRPSDQYAHHMRRRYYGGRNFFDPEYDFTLRIIDRSRMSEIDYICPNMNTYPSVQYSWKKRNFI